MLDTLNEISELVGIKNWLGDRILRAGFDLILETTDLFLGIDCPWIDADADAECGRLADGIVAESRPWFSLFTMLVRPMASMSNTAVASG